MNRPSPAAVVCGEALVDLTPSDGRFAAHLGGGPFNTAVALGRLGTPVAFCSRLSTDGFGQLQRRRLADAGVATELVVDAAEPTTLAVVTLSSLGEAEYQFYVEGTAAPGLLPRHLPAALPPSVAALHFGTLSLVVEPAASTYESLMQREHGRRVLALDPNCRPTLIADRRAYLRRLEGWLELMTLVKVSAADLAWLYPDADAPTVARRWRSTGVSLVVVTDGGRGARAFLADEVVAVPAPPVTVADTIGAGDTFNAGLLAWLHEHGALDLERIAALGPAEVEQLLRFAAGSAAVTCSRPGADPPWRAELAD